MADQDPQDHQQEPSQPDSPPPEATPLDGAPSPEADDSQRNDSDPSTLIPDLGDTFVVDPNETRLPADDVDASEAAAQLDSTVVPEDTTNEDPYSTRDVDPSKKTVDATAVDQTIEMDALVQADKPIVYASNEKTTPQSIEETTQFDHGGGDQSVQTGSIMTSANIGETINPRELSEKDAAFWGSLSMERDSKQDPSVLPPAIDRSLTETKLQIRGRHVVTPKSDPSEPSDYRLVRLLGKGGMGNVYVARQGSLDRLLAVKVIKPLNAKKREKLRKTGKLEAVEQNRRQQFLSEAVVTGDLDHPNIVPIHDIAVTADNTLFYSMKRVVGTPWSKVIQEKTLDENLEILLKAADAVGFAHTRGVVHRDIKPENIMLGDFGVVMVMDWGLALATPDFEKLESIFPSSGLGGSPAFMAPEMAVGPVSQIGSASDIYLLGATLFSIITGHAPHSAPNVSQCLQAVAANQIREVKPEHQGELMDIAMKAMSTRPEDRYPDVESFQKAIRDYRSHAQSIQICKEAEDTLKQGLAKRDYEEYSRASHGFEQAIKLWDGNREAQEGLAQTKLLYAEDAYEKGDFDLGLSLLDERTNDHSALIKKLRAGMRLRGRRKKLVRGLLVATAAMLAFILIGGSLAYRDVSNQRTVAQKEKQHADAARSAAEVARGIAEEKKIEAELRTTEAEQARADALVAEQEAKKSAADEKVQREKAQAAEAKARTAEADAKSERDRANRNADQARQNAIIAAENAEKEKQQRLIAQQATRRAEYEEFVSKIGLAKARIEQREFSDARFILKELRSTLESRGQDVGWEWRWLWNQANQSASAVTAPAAPADLSISPSGRHAVTTLADGTISMIRLSERGVIEAFDRVRRPGLRSSAAAISADQGWIAVGTFDGEGVIELWRSELADLAAGQPAVKLRKVGQLKGLREPLGRVRDLKFTRDGLLISASDDRTARVWDPHSQTELAVCWHIAPVVQVDAVGGGSRLQLAAVVSDDTTGKVVIWDLTNDGAGWSTRRSGDFLEHRSPVASVALSPDGSAAASGDTDGNVLLWKPNEVQAIDYADSIAASVARVSSRQADAKKPAVVRSEAVALRDHSEEVQWVSTQSSPKQAANAHSDAVKTIRFSADGTTLLTGSDDYTLKMWKVTGGQTLTPDSRLAGQLIKTLKGHGGWIIGAGFAGNADSVISASNDSTIRSWSANDYTEAAIVAPPQPARSAQPHDDAIWSARLSPDGTRVVSASRDHTAQILAIDPDTHAFRRIAVLKDDQQAAQSIPLREGSPFVAMSLAVDRNQNRLYIGSADSVVRIWDLQRGTELGRAIGTGLNSSLAVSRRGGLMLTGSSSPDAKAILWRLSSDGPPRIVHKLTGHDQAVTALAISADESKLFTGDRNGFCLLWDAKTGRPIGAPIDAVRGFRVNAAAFCRDGNQLLIASDNQQLTRIDLNRRQVVATMAHDGFVTRLSLSADGKKALTIAEQLVGDRIRTAATLWDVSSGRQRVLDRWDSPLKQKSRIVAAEFGGLNRRAVISRSATEDNSATVEIWNIDDDLDRASLLQKLELPERLGTAETAIPLSNQTLVSLNGEAAFKWDLATTRLQKSYRAHAAVTQASFSYDGKLVVTGSRSVKVWDAVSAMAIGKLESPHAGPVRSVHFCPVRGPGSYEYLLATGGDDSVVRLWHWNADAGGFKLIRQYRSADRSSQILGVSFSPDGKQLLAVGTEGFVRLWRLDASPDAPPTIYDLETIAAVHCGAFSRSGEYIAVGSDDRKARMWRVVPPGNPIPKTTLFEGHANAIDDITFLEDDTAEVRLLTASRDKSVRVWDPRIGETAVAAEDQGGQPKQGREIISLRKHSRGVTAVDASADGKLIVTAGSDGAVILWPAF